MRTASQKLVIIRLVEDSELSVRRTLDEIKVSRTSFYRWYSAYERDGLDGLTNPPSLKASLEPDTGLGSLFSRRGGVGSA